MLATVLLIVGLFLSAVRIFFSQVIPDFGLGNIDIVCISTPVICIIFGIVLFILGMKTPDLRIDQEPLTRKGDGTTDAMKLLDSRYAKGEITKEQYNEMKKEINK